MATRDVITIELRPIWRSTLVGKIFLLVLLWADAPHNWILRVVETGRG